MARSKRRRFIEVSELCVVVVALAATSEWLIGLIPLSFVRSHAFIVSAVLRAALGIVIWLRSDFFARKDASEREFAAMLKQSLLNVPRPKQADLSLPSSFQSALKLESGGGSSLPSYQRLVLSDLVILTPQPDIPSSVTFDSVHFSLTAPVSLPIESVCEIRFWAHLESQRDTVLKRAKQSLGVRDDLAVLFKSEGPFNLERGALLSVSMSVDGVVMTPSQKTVLWTGDIGSASFVITVPSNAQEGAHGGVASIRVNGAEIATLHFVLTVSRVRAASEVVQIPADLRYHKRAFASYASEDRELVITRVQGMESAWKGLKVFVDAAHLRAGQNWEQELWKTISEADVFYLFWCRHALRSTWVEKEWRYALEKRGLDFIDPVPLESPEFAPPPPSLAAKHFNDPWLAHLTSAGHGQAEGG